MDENHIKNIFKIAWSKTWSSLLTIGDLMSAALAIWVITRVVKFTIISILHAYDLYGVYGWAWQLSFGIYDVLTYMILRRHLQPKVPGEQVGSEQRTPSHNCFFTKVRNNKRNK